MSTPNWMLPVSSCNIEDLVAVLAATSILARSKVADVALGNVKDVTVEHQKALNCISQEDRLPPNHLTPDAEVRFKRPL